MAQRHFASRVSSADNYDIMNSSRSFIYSSYHVNATINSGATKGSISSHNIANFSSCRCCAHHMTVITDSNGAVDILGNEYFFDVAATAACAVIIGTRGHYFSSYRM